MAFAVTLSPASPAVVTVDYATADGTALAGADYEAARGALTFAAGETEKTVSVGVLADADDEGDETFSLTLAAPVAPGQRVAVDYLGSAMHPLADARGARALAWEDLPAVNVTGDGMAGPGRGVRARIRRGVAKPRGRGAGGRGPVAARRAAAPGGAAARRQPRRGPRAAHAPRHAREPRAVRRRRDGPVAARRPRHAGLAAGPGRPRRLRGVRGRRGAAGGTLGVPAVRSRRGA